MNEPSVPLGRRRPSLTESALAKGDCVVMSRFNEPMVRTSNAAEAERIAQRVSGYVLYPPAAAA